MHASRISKLAYDEFDKRIKNGASADRVPLSLALATTYRCNVSCVHCYVPTAGHPAEISTEETVRFLEEAAELGTLFLLLSGGDPLVRRDFLSVYRHARRLGMIVTLFTNGTLVTDAIADALAENAPFATEITVHSMRPGVFDEITGAKGSFERCMAGIRKLSERGLKLRLKSVAMRQNARWLHEVEAFAESIGAEYRFDTAIVPTLDREGRPLDVRLTPREVVDLDMSFRERRDELSRLEKPDLTATPATVFNCGGGRRSFSINPYGVMSMCPFTEYAGYDLRSGTVAEGWLEFIPAFLDRKPSTTNPCPGCDLLWLCNRCAAKSYLEMGHEEAAIPFWCEVAALRKQALEELTTAPDAGLDFGGHVQAQAAAGGGERL